MNPAARTAADGWPALDGLLTAPLRAGSVIATVYGDAILPRGGCLALSDLLALMGRLGVAEGVVRTAVSRLARDGVLLGRRAGRHSAYALTERAHGEFLAAAPSIYGAPAGAWDGRLRLAFPETVTERAVLEAAGFAALAQGALVSTGPAPGGVRWVEAGGPAETLAALAARAWPMVQLGDQYTAFIATFGGLAPAGAAPLEAMAARTLLIHAWRRIALRDPRLPRALLPTDWPGRRARALCIGLYGALAAASERWLDAANSGTGAVLPPGADPLLRFSAGCPTGG